MKRTAKLILRKKRPSRRFGAAAGFAALGGPAHGGVVLLRTFGALTIKAGNFCGYYERGTWRECNS